MLATNLYTHLDDLSGPLTHMVEAVNALLIAPGSQTDSINNGASGGTNGPSEDLVGQIAQIAQILSSPDLESLESLQ